MRKLYVLIVMVCVIGTSVAAIPELPGKIVKDTVVINFGNKSKIMILVDDPEELKKISEFDLNKMLKDLSISVDTMDNEERYLRIEDETGERYLDDTEIIIEDDEISSFRELKRELMEELIEELEDELGDDFAEEWKEKREEKRRTYKRTRSYFNLELGMNNWLENGKYPNESNALYTVRNWGSWYVAMANTNRIHMTGSFYLDLGASLSWYNFKFQNDLTRLEKGQDGLIFYEDSLITDPIKSKLTASYINASLVPLFSFGRAGRKRDLFNWDYYDKGFRIGAGAYVGYRLWSHTKYKWREDGNKEKMRDRGDYFLNNFRYGVRFVMGIRVVDVFINYDLNPIFIEGRAPKLNALSFGIIL